MNFSGHVLHDYARGNQKKLISNIEKFCSGSWRERIYQVFNFTTNCDANILYLTVKSNIKSTNFTEDFRG